MRRGIWRTPDAGQAAALGSVPPRPGPGSIPRCVQAPIHHHPVAGGKCRTVASRAPPAGSNQQGGYGGPRHPRTCVSVARGEGFGAVHGCRPRVGFGQTSPILWRDRRARPKQKRDSGTRAARRAHPPIANPNRICAHVAEIYSQSGPNLGRIRSFWALWSYEVPYSNTGVGMCIFPPRE